MEKVILVLYVNVQGILPKNLDEHMKEMSQKSKIEGVIQYFIPIREGDSRVECIYPKYVVGEQVDKEMNDVLERLNNALIKIEDEKQH